MNVLHHVLPFIAVGGILGWIEDHTVGYLRAGWQGAVGLVKDAVHALAAWVGGIISHVGGAWDFMVDGATALYHGLNWLGSEVYGTLSWVARVAIPDLARWTAGEVSALVGRIVAVLRWTAGQVADLVGRIAHAVASLTQWVVAHVWTPLIGYVRDIYAKLKQWAYTAWFYVTHPDKLAGLLWRYVVVEIAAGFDWAARYIGHFVVITFLNNLTRLVGFVESFLADIL